MLKKLLVKLLFEMEQELLRLGYTEGSMKFYRRRWDMLLQFALEKGEIYYSEQIGVEFLEEHFHILEKDFNRTLSQSEAQELRVIRMVGDFQLHNTVLRRYYKHKKILKALEVVFEYAGKAWRHWLSRRDQKGTVLFEELQGKFPFPKPRIVHNI